MRDVRRHYVGVNSPSLLIIAVFGGLAIWLLLGIASLVRKGPASAGGALMISSVFALTASLISVGIIRLLDSEAIFRKVTLVPTMVAVIVMAVTAGYLLRKNDGAWIRATIAGVISLVPVLLATWIVQQVVYCRFQDLCINL